MRQPNKLQLRCTLTSVPFKGIKWNKEMKGINAENHWKLDQSRREGKDVSKTKIDLQKSTKALRNK